MSFRICYATAIAMGRPTQIPRPVLVHSRSRRRGPASVITLRKYIKFVKPTKIPRPVVGHGLRTGQVQARKYTKTWCRIVTRKDVRLPPVYEEAAGSSPLAVTPQPNTGPPVILEEGSSPIVTTPAAPEAFEEWASSSSFDTIPGSNSGDEANSYRALGGGRYKKRVARAIGRFFCL